MCGRGFSFFPDSVMSREPHKSAASAWRVVDIARILLRATNVDNIIYFLKKETNTMNENEMKNATIADIDEVTTPVAAAVKGPSNAPIQLT